MLYTFNAPRIGLNTRYIRRIWPLCLGLLIFFQSATAQSIDQEITLASAIQRTLEQNPKLRVFQFRERALQGQAQTANLRPAFELGADIENIAGSDSFNGIDKAELTLSLSSVIELGDKRQARVTFVTAGRAQLEAQRQTDALDLLGEVTRQYIQVLAAQEKLILAKDAENLARDTFNAVQKRAKAGATPEAEVKRAQATLAQTHLTALAQQQQLQYRKVALAALWGDKTPTFHRAEGNLYQYGKDVDLAELYSRAEKNPSIQIFAAQERLQQAQLRLAQTQSSTDISWSVGIRQFQESNDTALVAGFSMPLFASDRNSGAIVAAKAARDTVYLRKEAALLKLHTQLYQAVNNRQQAIMTAKTLQKDIIPSLTEALEETQEAYQRGRYSYLELVAARQELMNVRRTMVDAATAALLYAAEIEQLTAEPLLPPQND